MATILVVDDQPSSRSYVTTLLGYFGHRILEAADGMEALAIANRECPGLVITDIVMPRMDGQELAARMKQNPALAGIPVIIHTATFAKQAEAICAAAGAFAAMIKPSEPKTILDLVNRALKLPPVKIEPDTVAAPALPAAIRLPRDLTALEAVTRQLEMLIGMSSELASERDPKRLVHSFGHMVRKLVLAKWAGVAIFDRNGRIDEQVVLSGTGAETLVLEQRSADILEKMIEDRGTVLLRNVAPQTLGLPLPPTYTCLTSFLAVPVQRPGRPVGWLWLAEKLGAEDFSEEDGRTAATLGVHMALAYEKAEREKGVDEELRRTKAMYEDLFESSPDAIAAIDREGRIVQVNAQAEILFGYSRAEFVGQQVEALVPERFRVAHPALRGQFGVNSQRRPMGGEMDLCALRKDGGEFPADIMLSLLKPREDGLVLAVIRDITARKRDEARIQQLNLDLEKHVSELKAANQDLEAFSYSVAHDLRSPVRQIHGFAGLLEEHLQSKSDPESDRLIGRIQSGAVHMAQLIDDLLKLAKLGRRELQVQPTPLNRLVAEVADQLKMETADRKIEWIVEPLPEVRCDPVLMKAVFTNLLSNAVKFTGKREQAVIRVGRRVENGEGVFFVADNGAGFNMRYADKLFGIFQRLHRAEDFPGTGVGLATVQRIIARHNGRIWADSKLDSGATFSFTLSASARTPEKCLAGAGVEHPNATA